MTNVTTFAVTGDTPRRRGRREDTGVGPLRSGPGELKEVTEVAEKKIAPKKADTSKTTKSSGKAQTRVTKKVAKVAMRKARVQ